MLIVIVPLFSWWAPLPVRGLCFSDGVSLVPRRLGDGTKLVLRTVAYGGFQCPRRPSVRGIGDDVQFAGAQCGVGALAGACERGRPVTLAVQRQSRNVSLGEVLPEVGCTVRCHTYHRGFLVGLLPQGIDGSWSRARMIVWAWFLRVVSRKGSAR